MSSKKRSHDGGEPEVSALPEGVEMREEGGLLVYSAKGVDLISRVPGAGTYTLLVDHPPTGNRAGALKQLCEPFDEQCACTCRDLANSL